MLGRLGDARAITVLRAGQAAAIGAMVLLCAYLAPRASSSTVVLFGAVLGGLLLVRYPQWGVALSPAACLVVPTVLGTGTNTELPFVLLLLGALLGIWLLRMLRRREWKLAASPVNLPLLVFVAATGLALVAGNALWDPMVEMKGNLVVVELGQWAVFGLSAGAFWLVANLVDDIGYLRWMVGAFLALGSLYVGQLLLVSVEGSLSGLYEGGATGSLFWVWFSATAASQALFNRRLRRPARLALALFTAAAMFLRWHGASRDWVSGWLPAGAALVSLVWLRSTRWGAGVTVVVAAAVIAFYGYVNETIIATAVSTGSFLRLDAARGILQLVGDRWLIGLGLTAYVFYWNQMIGYWAYSPTNVVALRSTDRVNAHNNYVDIFAQAGAIGLAAFVWLAVALWRQGWKARKLAADEFEIAYANGCLAGLVGSLVAGLLGDWFLPFVYNIGLRGMRASLLMWLFLGGTVAIARLRSAPGSQPESRS